ncbi:MAG: pantetheine-phosphate adenylyltransferase [Eubacterium sp.]|nr:pantetheine-phosphate adenylyltransferase [Eubacterium sp.]MCR4846432.1 pantetheine-phosphate adenylyltransferase [Eubacterium sp.]
MSAVIYPGSFDPVTLGHMDVIERASKMFDKVIVCILNNSQKKSPLFSLDERVNMLKDVTSGLDNVEVDSFQGLLVDFAKEKDVKIIIRGLREITDFANELKMAQGNHMIYPDFETLFIATDPKYSFVSSSMVREYASYGKSVQDFVPKIVQSKIEEKYI